MNTNTSNTSDDKTSTTSYTDSAKSIIIVGAGWSGLACAITLVQQGYHVYLLESAPQTGGRSRSVKLKHLLPEQEHKKESISGQIVDNGQHIMLGAYHYTLELFATLGLKETDVLERKPLELNMFSPDHHPVILKSHFLPAPFHLLMALATLKGFSLTERFYTIRMALKLAISRYKLKQDMSVKELLQQHKQAKNVIDALWEPLCLATMNTPIHSASGQVFLNVLKDSFSKKRQDSDLLFFKRDLCHAFNLPAIHYIKNNGSQVLCSNKVTELHFSTTADIKPEGKFSLHTVKQNYKTNRVVLATPAHISEKLLHNTKNRFSFQKTSFLKPQTASLRYIYEPICTVYMQYPANIQLPKRMVGLYHTIGQWAIDRSLSQQPGLIAVVISGPGKHRKMSHVQLIDIIHTELQLIIKNLPKPIDSRVITEKRATFSCHLNIEQQRPKNRTSISGLYLAGDYTDTGYPSTLEGAIKSGVITARQIIKMDNAFTL